MEKFKELVSLCNASVKISVNNHKDYYESVEEYISEEELEDIDEKVFKEMVKRNTVVEVQVYPNTPVSFFIVYHFDIDEAIDIALNVIKKTSK